MVYTTDILGDPFEQRTLTLKDDYEGKITATLVRSVKNNKANTAVLYIHGFNDYFFQKEMAFNFNNAGHKFYALDLRKYGRSYLPHQKFNDIRDLKDYNEEISESLDIIRSEGSNKIILMGHSTGGLIATIYAKNQAKNGCFDGLILNSPFFEFNMSSWILGKLIPSAARIGYVLPTIKIDGALSKEYGESLHKDYDGEWDYKLEWKPNTPPPVSLGWLRAIRNGHLELKETFSIDQPVLVLHSTETITNKFDKVQMQTMDAVLSVTDIGRIARNIKGDVEITPIKNGMHDLILSRKDVRNHVYEVVLNWLSKF